VPDVLSDEEVALMSRLYDAEVAYQDEALGELRAMLSDQKLVDNTWLIVMSDHGELFGEWDMVYHTASNHYQLLHVPLMVRPPQGVSPARIDAPVQPVDVFVTLLEAAGLEPPATVRRAYRLPLDSNDPVERELCIAQAHAASIGALSIAQNADVQLDLSRWMAWTTSVVRNGRILELDELRPRGLYDVHQDPEMRHDLLATSSDAAAELVRHFQSWRGQGKEGELVCFSEDR
jgi:arylsulfatase A-like enzyme